jgi:hypothetical protein
VILIDVALKIPMPTGRKRFAKSSQLLLNSASFVCAKGQLLVEVRHVLLNAGDFPRFEVGTDADFKRGCVAVTNVKMSHVVNILAVLDTL